MQMRRHIFPSGERFPVLVSDAGFPASLTTQFTIDRLRGRRQVNTIECNLGAIGALYDWAASCEPQIEPEALLRSSSLLSACVRTFCTYIRVYRYHDVSSINAKQVLPHSRVGHLSNNTRSIRVCAVREFVVWAARVFLEKSASVRPKSTSAGFER